MAGPSFTYVYLLRSEIDPSRVYVGQTRDLRQRLADHNAAKAKHTSKFRPWRIETYVAFSDHDQALRFRRRGGWSALARWDSCENLKKVGKMRRMGCGFPTP
jgi:putative endonuclease